MNKVCQRIWSKIEERWILVLEKVAHGYGPAAIVGAIIMAAFMLQSGNVSALDSGALPTNGKITSGKGSISTSGSQMTIKQSTKKMIANWDTFNIGSKAGVTFRQPNSDATALNRIYDQNPSQILGSLSANGNVFLINPSGIIFGQNARINVGGLVASSLNMADSDFMSGKYTFLKTGNAGNILNQGNISVIPGGVVALIAPAVTNEGTITAKGGSVFMGAGNQVTLDFKGDGLISYTIDQGALGALAENRGLIHADGGVVVMTAEAADSLTQAVVNNSGIIEAQTLQGESGRILLLSDMNNGETIVGGKLDASAPRGGNGGFIETSGSSVAVDDDVVITTVAPIGTTGTWEIDPYDFTIASSGGDITGTALSTALNSNSVTIQTNSGSVSCTGASCGSGTAGNGDIFVNDNITWTQNTLTLDAYRNIDINKEMFGSGTAKLSLLYGQGAVAAGNTAIYTIKAPVNLPAGNNFSTKLGSDGTAISYYVITTLGAAGSTTGTDLQGMNGDLSRNYALGGNIDASTTSTWNPNGSGGYYGFTPIGKNNGSPFTGQFDGLGHTISNLYINRPAGTPGGTGNNVGLFGVLGKTNVSAVSNVRLVGGSVLGGAYVGGLVGYIRNGTVSNSYVTGNVTGSVTDASTYVGGLVGYIQTGMVSNSYATGNVTGNLTGNLTGTLTVGYNNNVGGLVGYNQTGTVSNSYATGSVTGNLTGILTVSYNNNVGGLIGSNAGTVSNTYSTGSVTGTSTGNVTNNFGGLVGNNSNTVSSSYWDTETTGTSTGIGRGSTTGATGLTTAQMMTMSSFSGWDIANTGGTTTVWRIYEGYTYPLLRHFLVPVTFTPVFDGPGTYGDIAAYTADITGLDVSKVHATTLSLLLSSSATAGEATAAIYGDLWSYQDGYDITTATRTLTGTGSDANDLRIGGDIAWSSNKLILNAVNNIDIDSTLNGSGTAQLDLLYGQGAVTAGNTATYNVNAPVDLPEGYNFSTKLGSDGTTKNYYVITNLGSAGSTTTTDLQGMNGNLTGYYALGSNLDAAATSTWNAGLGFTPIGNATTAFTGTFEGLGHTVSNLSINRPSESYVGLFGYIGTGGAVSNVGLVDGNVNGSSNAGALAGINFGTVSNSYAIGSVGGSFNTGILSGYNGGIVQNSYTIGSASGVTNVGGMLGGNGGIVKDSYNTGNVIGKYYVGGLIGYNSGTIESSYSTGNAIGNSKLVGGLVGYNMGGTIENSYATGITSGNFDVGGLVGYNRGTIKNSYATGSTSGVTNVGGLAGGNHTGVVVENCYVMGNVTGNYYVGGLIGYNIGTIESSYFTGVATGNKNLLGGLVGYNNTGGIIKNSYAAGSIDGYNYVGGLVGVNKGSVETSYATSSITGILRVGGLIGSNTGSVTNSFWDVETSGRTTSAGGIGKTTAEMMTPSTFTDAGWDTTNIWKVASYPTLRVFD